VQRHDKRRHRWKIGWDVQQHPEASRVVSYHFDFLKPSFAIFDVWNFVKGAQLVFLGSNPARGQPLAIKLCSETPCDVIVVDSGDEAVAILKAKGDVDLILTDIRMPGEIDGAELARSVRGRQIVILSAYVDTQQQLPVEATFRKPVRSKSLQVAGVAALAPISPASSADYVQKGKAARSWAAFFGLFDFDPSASVPLTVPFVLAPPVVIAVRPFPVVTIDVQLQFAPIVRPFANVPAITIIVAYDGR
jgi:CheY-like chemotaxis protein